MRLHIGNESVTQAGRRTKKQDDSIFVLRNIAGYLIAPGLAANIFASTGQSFFRSYSYDNDLMSLTFAFYLWAYIIIPIFSLPYHIYFVKYGKATLRNYILLWTSIGIATAIIFIVLKYRDCYLGIACSTVATAFVFIPALKLVLIGCLGGLIFWFIVCWRHNFNASDRSP